MICSAAVCQFHVGMRTVELMLCLAIVCMPDPCLCVCACWQRLLCPILPVLAGNAICSSHPPQTVNVSVWYTGIMKRDSVGARLDACAILNASIDEYRLPQFNGYAVLLSINAVRDV